MRNTYKKIRKMIGIVAALFSDEKKEFVQSRKKYREGKIRTVNY